MPGKNNTSLKNLHRLYLAMTGGGKSFSIENDPFYKSAPRVIAWDPESEYKGLTRFGTVSELARALATNNPKGKYRYALTCDDTKQNFEKFCKVLWTFISSDWPVVILVDELADVQNSGAASPYWGRLIKRGRKYGVSLIVASQRPAEIDKTVYSQCRWRWVGNMETEDRERAAKSIGIDPQKLAEMGEFDAYRREPGQEPELIKAKTTTAAPRKKKVANKK